MSYPNKLAVSSLLENVNSGSLARAKASVGMTTWILPAEKNVRPINARVPLCGTKDDSPPPFDFAQGRFSTVGTDAFLDQSASGRHTKA